MTSISSCSCRSKGEVNPEVLCPFESGMQLLRVPETDFIRRVMSGTTPAYGEKRAKAFYTSLWKLLIDARTAERKEKLRKKKPSRDVEREAEEWLAEMARNEGTEDNRRREKEWEERTRVRVTIMEKKGKMLMGSGFQAGGHDKENSNDKENNNAA